MMSPGKEIDPKLIIFQPDGPQGGRLGLRFENAEQYEKFDQVVGQFEINERKSIGKLKKAAEGLGIPIVKP